MVCVCVCVCVCVSLNRLDSEEIKTLDSCHEPDSDFPVQPVS